jgi:hypothetical protein
MALEAIWLNRGIPAALSAIGLLPFYPEDRTLRARCRRARWDR